MPHREFGTGRAIVYEEVENHGYHGRETWRAYLTQKSESRPLVAAHKMGDDVSTNTVSSKARAAARRLSDTLHTAGVTGPFALARPGAREGDESLVVRRAHRWLGERADTFDGFPVVWSDDY
jgi:hypothetical protein